ncbi:MAG: hypothetical protein GAK28_00707 [Luteibacter sp.]|uniref:DUF2730 family protein n=1 Tax=Luteibacter sp. TaxID=1886636 RepID=UPI00137DE0F7|nr:DUF2730 family protein [Luteibacter sp.]KAF1009074.1 MAG: hypothetical protein GAK28_00707 [Luteibacter sp.]
MNEPLAIAALTLLVVILFAVVVVGLRVNRRPEVHVDTHDVERRLTRLEARVDNLPTHGDLRRVHESISELAENTAELTGQTATVTQLLRTIQEHLLDKDR